jgi:flagellar biosynthesis/type III secretory pathway protein FliH
LSKIIHNPSGILITPMQFPQATEDLPPGVTPFVAPPPSVGAGRTQNPAASETWIHEIKESARKAGFDEGLARGQKEGRGAAAKLHQVQLSQLQSTVGQMLAYRSTIRTEVEREVVDLAFAAARRILRREATLDRTAAAGIVRSCMDEKSNSEVTRVLVHPDDLEQVRLSVGSGTEVVASKDVARGGALLETTSGVLDARIDSQLDELQTGLADA